MDKQTIFDTVVRHLGRQGHPAMNGAGRCVYRAPDGSKCAVGCLIPDELYRPEMDTGSECGSSFGVGSLDEYFKLPDYFAPNGGLLSVLQNSHDGWAQYGLGVMLKRLQKIAEQFNLKPDVIAEAFPQTVEA